MIGKCCIEGCDKKATTSRWYTGKKGKRLLTLNFCKEHFDDVSDWELQKSKDKYIKRMKRNPILGLKFFIRNLINKYF